MSTEQERIALIDSIYEAVLDNDRWPSVLERMRLARFKWRWLPLTGKPI
jgi:hypothetical protein